jgi:hypothetical protein
MEAIVIGLLVVVVSLVVAWEGHKLYFRRDFSSFLLAKRLKAGQEEAAARYFGIITFTLSATCFSSLLIFAYPSLKNILFLPIPACLIAILVGVKRFCNPKA